MKQALEGKTKLYWSIVKTQKAEETLAGKGGA